MSIKRKLIISAILMLIIPTVLIIILSVLLISLFVIIHPEVKLSAVSGISVSNPYVIRFITIWAAAAAGIFIISGICIALYVGKNILIPLKSLSVGVEHLKNGDLSYEFVGSGDRELKELFASFEELRLRLQHNVRQGIEEEDYRRTLLVNLSHDIKTPVTSIKGYVEGIREGVANTPEKRLHYLNTIYIKAESIERMADNLSVYSKLEMGRMQYTMSRVDLIDLLRNSADEFAIDLEGADMSLELNLPETAVYCSADTENIRRVISNIVTNAIKYKLPGGGSLKISAKTCENGLLISFADRGRGIPAEDLEHIFDGFFRADQSRNGAIPGNGLGLSVCRMILADHGGKIWARNRRGGGCEFIILLPVCG